MKSIYLILLFIGFAATVPAQGVKSFKDATNKYGLKDSKGNVIVSPKYNFINEFKDGLARVSFGNSYNNWLYGFIDSTGKEIIPLKYSQAEGFSEGLACVKL